MDNRQFRPGGFKLLPPVVKNLLIINGLFFLATISLKNVLHIDLNEIGGLYFMGSEKFQPFQFLSYMFLHGDITHLFFNMFAFWMFGNAIENVWGAKKFVIYYFVTGIGAAFLHQLVQFIESEIIINEMLANGISMDIINDIINTQMDKYGVTNLFPREKLVTLVSTYHAPTVGASGSVFGVLLAFGMLFPNSLIYLYFAIPIKAKWMVIGYGALELWAGISASPGDNIAHFAHLGGMLFGFILIKMWKKKENNNRWIS